jgi:hypothetical protein
MGALLKLGAFLWKHRQEVIELEEAIRALVLQAKQDKAA